MEQNPSSQNPPTQVAAGLNASGRCLVDGLDKCTEQQLETLLRSIQRRLGTSQEELGDFDYARVIAHELNNLLTVSRLRQGMASGTNPISS